MIRNIACCFRSLVSQNLSISKELCTVPVPSSERKLWRITEMANKKKVFLSDNPHAEAAINTFVNLGFDKNEVIDTLYKQPELLRYLPSRMSDSVSLLQQYGFDNKSIIKMSIIYPSLLLYSPTELSNSFETWRSSHLGEEFLRNMFVRNPVVFSVNDVEVRKRVLALGNFVNNKVTRLINLLTNNPNVMFVEWKNVEKIFLYLNRCMRVTEKDISQSSAFSHSLAHIKLRHTFLDRCGVYKRQSIRYEEYEADLNVPLHKIIDTDDYTFAVNVAQVSDEEFEVFKDLMHYEDEDKHINDPDLVFENDLEQP